MLNRKAASSISILRHEWNTEANKKIEKVLYNVFAGEGYSNSDEAKKAFTSEKLNRRGIAFIAIETATGYVAGVIFYVPGGVGACQIADTREAEIHLLAVHPLYRGSGLGKKLITACLAQAKSENVTRTVLSTQASMTYAHRLYAQMGFIRNKTRDWPRPAGGTYVVYEKAVTLID